LTEAALAFGIGAIDWTACSDGSDDLIDKRGAGSVAQAQL
jgi:hypothetical protein